MGNTVEKILRIGRFEAILNVCIALAIDIAVIVASCVDENSPWIWENGSYWKFCVFALLMLYCGVFFGKKCATAIALRQKSFAVAGVLCAFATVLSAAALTGIIAFLADLAYEDASWEMATKYIAFPVVVIVLYTGIPIAVHGVIFGYRIRNKARKI